MNEIFKINFSSPNNYFKSFKTKTKFNIDIDSFSLPFILFFMSLLVRIDSIFSVSKSQLLFLIGADCFSIRK